jgi:hypothetical protein
MDAVSDLLLGSGYSWEGIENLTRILGGGHHNQFRQHLMGRFA